MLEPERSRISIKKLLFGAIVVVLAIPVSPPLLVAAIWFGFDAVTGGMMWIVDAKWRRQKDGRLE